MPTNMNYDIFQDHLGFLWFANEGGLVRYDGYECKIYSPDSLDPYSIGIGWVNHICEDSQGNLWIGSPIRGINKYERRTGRFFHFVHNPKDNASLLSDSIFSCYIDRSDILWIVHSNGMLDRLDTKTGVITHNPHMPKNTAKSSKYAVFMYRINLRLIAIFEDQNGDVWIGTRGAGVFRYSRKLNTYTQFLNEQGTLNSISCDTVTCIYEDKNDNLWMGTWGGGLNCFKPETNSFSTYRRVGNNENSLSNDFCLHLFEDKSNRLWITVQGGLDVFDARNNKFIHFKNKPDDPGSLNYYVSHERIFAIPFYENNENILWIHIGGSMNRRIAYDIFDPRQNTFFHYYENINNPGGLRGVHSNAFFGDNSGIVWISGNERGIN